MRLAGVIVVVLLFVACLVTITGCCPPAPAPIIKREVVTVEVPVQIKTKLPPEIVNGSGVDLPEFVTPGDPAATSALTAEGERRLKVMLLIFKDLRTAVKQWNESE